MYFSNLYYFWFLLLIPALLLFFFWSARSRRLDLRKFAQSRLLGYLTQEVDMSFRRIKTLCFLLCFLMIVLALAQPRWGYHWETVKRRGLDIVIALDLSKSMLAEDIKPNRIQAAKREIKSLINAMKGDRIAIVGFSGSAFVQCPLTLDYGTAKLFLDSLRVGAIPVPGTNIAEAIMSSIKAFDSYDKKHQVIFIITDGENHGRDIVLAAKEAKKKGIAIFPIGIASPEGAPIPFTGKDGKKEFIKDSRGNIVISKLDLELLNKIASLTGGKTGIIGTSSFPLEEIYQQKVSKMEKKEIDSRQQKKFYNRFQVPLFAAIIFYLIYAVLPERRHC